MARPSPTVHDLVAQLREHLIPEIVGEIATAEIALCGLGVTAFVLVTAFVVGRRRARTPEAAGAVVGWRIAQFAVLVMMFAIWTIQVSRSGWLTRADNAVLSWFVAHRSGTWTAVAVMITDVGSPVGIGSITVALAGYTWWRRRSITAAALLPVVVGVAAAGGTVTKLLVARARPPAALHLLTETDFSYPSGHVTATSALVGTVLLVYGANRTFRWRCAAVGCGAIVIVSVATTRLYLGVHWFSDVAGGAILAATVVTGAASYLALVRAVRHRSPDAVPDDSPPRRPGIVAPDPPCPRPGPPSRDHDRGDEGRRVVGVPIMGTGPATRSVSEGR